MSDGGLHSFISLKIVKPADRERYNVASLAQTLPFIMPHIEYTILGHKDLCSGSGKLSSFSGLPKRSQVKQS